jgi:2-methylcitrate dehydratase
MYPTGHARNTTADLDDVLGHKFKMLGALATGGNEGETKDLVARFSKVGRKSVSAVAEIHDFPLVVRDRFE